MPVVPRPRAVWASGLVLSLLLAPLVVLGSASPAAAAITVPFTQRFSANTNGSVVIRGNTLMTCSASTACTTAQSSVGSATATSGTSNNDHTSVFVDVDGDPATFNSSSATVTVPAGGSVLFAALVWGGRTEQNGTAPLPTPALRGQAKLKVPGSTAYQQLVADEVHDLTSNGTPGAYQGYADVTEEVRAAGSGTYTVADVQAGRAADRYAGWSLVLAVSDPQAPARNLTVYTGFGSVTNTSGPVDIPVSGFLTPPAGPVRTSLGFVAYEGDQGLVGDSLRLDGTALSNARNPATNIFNSSITDAGVATSGRTPSYANQLGFDADQIAADGILANGASSATIRLTTGGETFYPGVVTFATDLYDPKLLGTKTVTDLDGGDIEAGDVLEYRVPVQNVGLDTAVRSTFFDAVPTGTVYEPGSLSVDGHALTDAGGDDAGSFVLDDNQGHLSVNVGAGASASSGGSVPADAGVTEHVVLFRVTVAGSVTDGQQLVNAAGLTYRGATTLASSASATNAVISPVVAPAAPGNQQPVASPHIVSFTPAPGARTLTVPVLAGDSDPDGDPLTVVGLTDGAGGPVTLDPDGTVTYAPAGGFAGRDVFTYTVSDGRGGTSTATVQVDVVNTVPVAEPDTATTPAATAVDVDVLGNDTDANGDALAVRSVDALSAQGATLVVQPDGRVRYTPAAGFRGTDTFSYVVEDSRGGSDTATVTLTVTNRAPVAVADTYSTQAGQDVGVAVRGNDSEPDGDPTTLTLLAAPTRGTLTLAGDGTGTYSPAPGLSGTDTFTYRLTDDRGASSTATVTVTVNGAPTAVADSTSTATDTEVLVAVLANDTDPDGDTLTVSAAADGAHGTVVPSTGGRLAYTPSRGWAGTDTFTYSVSDGRGGTGGTTVTVVTDNADPVAVPDEAGTGPDTAVTVDVLGNDTDANIPGTTQVLGVTDATADQAAEVTVGTDGRLTVTPAPGHKGDITVTYTVSDGADGSATGLLVVTVSDAAPVAVADGPRHTATGASLLLDVLDNDTDPNGDTLSLVAGSPTDPVDADGTVRGTAVVEDGQVRYAPPAGFAGTVTFGYTVTDGTLTATGTVTVVVDDAAPVGVDDTARTGTGRPVTVDVLANDTDANIPGTGQELVVVAATATAGASVVLEEDGRLTVTPAARYRGLVVVTYTVSDGAGGTDTATLTVTVEDAAPVAGPDTAGTAYLQPVAVDLLDDDTDADGDTLTVVPGSVGTPRDAGGTARGTVTLSGGTATYTPPAGFSGTVTFDYAVTDGTHQDTATVTVTVANGAPVAAPDSMRLSGAGPVTVDVLGNDTDPDGGTLRLVAVARPAHGSAAVVDGRLVYTPEPGWSGPVTVTYTVEDGQGGTATATLTLDVAAPPAPPAGPVGPVGPGTPSGPADPAVAGPARPAGAVPVRAAGAAAAALPSRLARTGVETPAVVAAGLALLVGGAVLVAAGRPSRGAAAASPRGRHRAG